MSLIKGNLSLTRYLVLDDHPDLTDEFIGERLRKNALMDIESTAEEESIGWVEVLEPMQTEFGELTFSFGMVKAMGFRIDTRKVPAKMVKKYFAMAEEKAENLSEKPLTAEDKRLLKAKVKQDLLARMPVTTDVYEVCWLPEEKEVLLAATGKKKREYFEDLWRRSFGMSLLMKIPIVLADIMLPKDMDPEILSRISSSALVGGGR